MTIRLSLTRYISNKSRKLLWPNHKVFGTLYNHDFSARVSQTGTCRFKSTSTTEERKQLKILYDGECPICVTEVNLLKKIDRKRSNLNFYDITKGEYKPEEHAGIQYKDAIASMHVVGTDGQIHTKMDAVRELYKGAGLGFVASILNLPGVYKLADKGYDWFAVNRHRLTGRNIDCETGRCKLDQKKRS